MPINNDKTVIGYIPQLDALRAIAVMLVIVSHWFDPTHLLNRYTHNGETGVTLFFVLSGFLITGILLNAKEQHTARGSISAIYKAFYVRRALRIFPVYFLLLLVLWVLGNKDFLSGWAWHMSYLSNVYFYIEDSFSGNVAHFWSLAVEEQFYLLWPSLLLFYPTRKYPVIFITLIAIAVVFRFLIVTPDSNLGRLLLPGSLDSFGIGGWLAWSKHYYTRTYQFILAKPLLFFIGGVALFMLALALPHSGVSAKTYAAFFYLYISLFFGIVILLCAEGKVTGITNTILTMPSLLYIGKISYGIYLFHNFIPYLYGLPMPVLLQPISIYLVQFLRLLLLIALASASWFLFEKPILGLKKYFSY